MISASTKPRQKQGQQQSLWSALCSTIRRDLILAYRSRSDILNPLMFFLIVVTLFPLGVSPESAFLAQIAPGVIWVSALLATMLAMDNLFSSDYNDGSLEQLLLSPQPLYFLVLGKIFCHWLVSGLPVVLLAPVLALMLSLPEQGLSALVFSLLLGTPILSLIGAIGVALTVGLERGGLLLAVLVLPLCIPVLVFGASAVKAATSGLPIAGHLALLGAMLALAVTLAPLATVAALKISVN